jgi:hypothetical protein
MVSAAPAIDYETLARIPVRGICPVCTPARSRAHQRLKTLRVWHDGDFASYSCAHCGIHGYAHSGAARLHQSGLAERIARAQRVAEGEQQRRDTADWLWRSSVPAPGTPVEVYLREARGLVTAVPLALRYLPARGPHAHAMIAGFTTSVPTEDEPGVYSPPETVTAVHLTRLLPDGSGKLKTEDNPSGKIVVGPMEGAAIFLVPPGDGNSVVLAEGIEDGLSMVQETGMGCWVAGSAGRLPRLTRHIAAAWYLESCVIIVDGNTAGEENSRALAEEIVRSRSDVEVLLERGRSLRYFNPNKMTIAIRIDPPPLVFPECSLLSLRYFNPNKMTIAIRIDPPPLVFPECSLLENVLSCKSRKFGGFCRSTP